MVSVGVRRVLAVIDWLSLAGAVIAAIMIFAIAVLILGEVAIRVFRHTMLFAWEYGGYLNGAVFFLAAAHTIRTGGHIRVTLVQGRLSSTTSRSLEILVTIFGLCVAGLLSVSLSQYAYESYVAGVTSDTIMATPLVFPKSALAVGAILLTLQMAARLVRLLLGDAPDADAADELGV